MSPGICGSPEVLIHFGMLKEQSQKVAAGTPTRAGGFYLPLAKGLRASKYGIKSTLRYGPRRLCWAVAVHSMPELDGAVGGGDLLERCHQRIWLCICASRFTLFCAAHLLSRHRFHRRTTLAHCEYHPQVVSCRRHKIAARGSCATKHRPVSVTAGISVRMNSNPNPNHLNQEPNRSGHRMPFQSPFFLSHISLQKSVHHFVVPYNPCHEDII